MHKFIFALVFGLLLPSCQNTPKNAPDATIPAPLPVPSAPASAEETQQATDNVAKGLKMLEALRNQVDALPSKIKKENQTQIDGIYGSIEGLMTKSNQMLKELTAASKLTNAKVDANASEDSGANPLDAAQVKDYNESAARYAIDIQHVQEDIQKLIATAK